MRCQDSAPVDISKYGAYFHDGRLLDIGHVDGRIQLSMVSAQVDREDISEDIPLVGENSLQGVLHIEGVHRVSIDGDPFDGALVKLHDFGEIFDLSVVGGLVKLMVEWIDFPRNLEVDNFSVLKIEGEKVWWESRSDLAEPYEQMGVDISRYESFFHDGDVFDIQHRGTELLFSLSSAEMDDEDLVDDVSLSRDGTLQGVLYVEGIKNLMVNDVPVSGHLEKMYDDGTIFRLRVSGSSLEMMVEWSQFPSRVGEEEFQVIVVEAQRIWWETIPDLEDSYEL